MTLRDAIIEAVTKRDPHKAGRLVDFLRERFGFNYQRVYEYVNKYAPIDAREWESLLYEADSNEPPEER